MLKIQDIVFLATFCFLILKYRNNPKIFVFFGLVCLVFSIPLFSLWIFFTAERLNWYAGAFFLTAIIFYLINIKRYDGE